MLTSACPCDWTFETRPVCADHNNAMRLIFGMWYFRLPKIACLNKKKWQLLKFRFHPGLDLAHIHLYSLGEKGVYAQGL